MQGKLLINTFFQVLANDTGGLQDMARVFIYLLREDQRVRFILRQQPVELRNRIEIFREYVILSLNATHI